MLTELNVLIKSRKFFFFNFFKAELEKLTDIKTQCKGLTADLKQVKTELVVGRYT